MKLTSAADANVTEKRNLYVGGSDVPTILGLNKYKTQFELAQEKLGIVEDTFNGNEYTEYGNIMEPQIRQYINTVNGTNFKPDTVIDEDNHMRSNTDGFEDEHKMILEIKTHGKNINTKPYIAQMQLYMYQFNVDHGWLALYERPKDFDAEFDSDLLEIHVIERDDAYIDHIIEAIETFWIRCEFLRERPEATETDFNSFGQNEVAPLVQKIANLESDLLGFKELEKQYKEAKQQLHDAMEAYDIKKFDADTITITRVLPTTSMTFDSSRFKKENPEMAEQYQKESKRKGYVKINLKEAK